MCPECPELCTVSTIVTRAVVWWCQHGWPGPGTAAAVPRSIQAQQQRSRSQEAERRGARPLAGLGSTSVVTTQHWGLATGCQETRTCDSDSDSNGDGAPVHPLSECWARLPGLGSGLPLNRHSELWLHCMMIWWWRGGGGLVEERDWYFYPLQTDGSIKWQMWNVFFFLSATLFIPRC